jgi:anti-sigma-K factor RskA
VIAGLEAQEPAMAEAIKAYEQEVAQITAEGEQELAAIDKEVDAKEVEFNAMAEQEVQDETRSDIASL